MDKPNTVQYDFFKFPVRKITDEEYYLNNFELRKKYDSNPKNVLNLSPTSQQDIDALMRAGLRSHDFRRNNYALNYFAYRGVKNQYKTVDTKNTQQQQSYLANIHYYKTGNFAPNSNYQTDLSIVKQSYQDAKKLDFESTVVGAFADIAGWAYPAAKTFNLLWLLGGDEVKKAAKTFSYDDYIDTAKIFINKHGTNKQAITDFMQQQTVSEESILKALLENTLKNQGMSDKKIEQKCKEITLKFQEKLTNQAKDASITKTRIQAEISAELSEDITNLSGAMEDIRQQVGVLSDKLSEHMTTVDIIKYSKINFEYNTNEIKGLSECAQFLNGLATFTHSPELALAAKFTNGIAGITGALNQLENLKILSKIPAADLIGQGLSSVGPLALAGGYAAVGFAVFSLVSSFIDQGPSSDQVMMEFLQDLANFIADEFKKVHEKLDAIHKDMIKGFDLTLKISQRIFELQTNTLYAVQHVSKQIYDLKNLLTLELNQISTEISILTDLVKSGLETINEASFTSTLRQLNDLLTASHHVDDEQVTSQVQPLMNTLVGDHVLGKSPIDYYTGAFYFNPKIFKSLTVSSTSTFFSPLVEIDDNDFFYDSSKKDEGPLARAMRIIKILDNHKLTSLIGFFANYAQDILSDKYKSAAMLTAEEGQLAHAIKSTKKNIKDKEKHIKKFAKKSLSDTEKNQLAQDKINLKKMTVIFQSYKTRQQRLAQLKKPIIKAEKESNKKLEKINDALQILLKDQTALKNDITQEQHKLTSITEDIKRLCPGLNFLYYSQVPSEYYYYQMFYQNFYKKQVSLICNKETLIHNKHHANEIQERLGLIADAQGNMAFNCSTSEDGKREFQTFDNVYEKTAYHMANLFAQTKKVEALNANLDLLDQEIVRLETSKKLDAIYTTKPLSDRLVFNPKLWILAVHKYLNVVQHPTLGNFYTDHGFQHAQKLITMAQNQIQFIHELKGSPELFKTLWTNYATTLVYIHHYYQKGWKKYFKDLDLPSNTLLESEVIANPLLVLEQEGDYALKTLENTKFKELLIILEAHKRLLNVFYQLVQPNTHVMHLLNSLWDKDTIRTQLRYLKQKERKKAPFTTYEIYNYLNQAYLDIAKYQSLDYPPSADIIQLEIVSILKTHLQRHVQAVQSDRQLAFYSAAAASRASLPLFANNHPDGNLTFAKERSMDNEFECLVNKALENANMRNSNNAVLFVGETRTGKSAFIAYLLGCDMQFEDVGASTDILTATNCPTDNVPTIGHQPISQTLFPAGYTYDGSSRPRELPPQALTDPYVNLSIHTAPLIHNLTSKQNPNAQTTSEKLCVPASAKTMHDAYVL